MMVYAVEKVNQRHELGNLTLGYHIVDSCGDVTTALKNTQSFMRLNREYSHDHAVDLEVCHDKYSCGIVLKCGNTAHPWEMEYLQKGAFLLMHPLTNVFVGNTDLTSAQQSPPPVLAVIGGYYSEISIAVTRQLNLENIPQVWQGL